MHALLLDSVTACLNADAAAHSCWFCWLYLIYRGESIHVVHTVCIESGHYDCYRREAEVEAEMEAEKKAEASGKPWGRRKQSSGTECSVILCYKLTNYARQLLIA